MSQKMLIVGPSWVGDMMMAQALFKLLKSKKKVDIDVLAPEWSIDLLSLMPEINESILMPIPHGKLNLKKRWEIGKSLKAKQYDQAILLPNSFKSALIPLIAAIPKRTGYKGEHRYGLINDMRQLDKKHYPRLVEQYMVLGLERFENLPNPYQLPSLVVKKERQCQLLNKFNLHQDSPILALAPGAQYGSSKCWPIEYFASVANQKLKEGWQVWVFGSTKDLSITDQLLSLTNNRAFLIAGKTNLLETVTLLSLANCLVTNDSGLMHIAAALGIKLVALYGSSTPLFTPPLTHKAFILQKELSCRPCFKRECPLKHHQCMHAIKPSEVLSAIQIGIN